MNERRDPCPGCVPGGTCGTPECGRVKAKANQAAALESDALTVAYMHGVAAESANSRRKQNALQARIDALMLEYEPEEMSDAQIARWAASQVVKS